MYSWSDAKQDMADEAAHEAAIVAALDAAEGIAEEFTERHSSEQFSPELRARLSVGSDDQPLFLFTLFLDIDEDILDPDDYPSELVHQLRTEIKDVLWESDVVGFAWLVSVASKHNVSAA